MKRFFLVLIVLALILTSWGFVFYWKNLRGSGAVFRGPRQSITELLNKARGDVTQKGIPTDDGIVLPEGTVKTGPLTHVAGFSLSTFAEDLGRPRVMTWDNAGNILVSLPWAGEIVAVTPDSDEDGKNDGTVSIINGLDRPHGLALRCRSEKECSLYVAETNKVVVYGYDSEKMSATNRKVIAVLPGGGGHFTRTLLFMPSPDEDTLLVSVGSTCNACNESDDRRASVLAIDTTDNTVTSFAKGLRNTVFMNIHPVTGAIWGTDMGRDLLGDDIPPDEVNIIEEGKNYGWPYCYGKKTHDAVFDKQGIKKDFCANKSIGAHIEMSAHSSPLGLAFFPEEGWPEDYWYDLLVAYHGSWNRTEPTGYKIVRYKLDENGNYEGEEDFIIGWLMDDGSSLGRPVDILIQPGGVIYISDDKAGVIYKMAYSQDNNDKSDLIRVFNVEVNATIKSPLTIKGEARGYWFFEADFPVKVVDAKGTLLGRGIAGTQSDWMTEDFVSFEATVDFDAGNAKDGYLILEKDNPSGLPEHADELRIPVVF